MNVYVTEFLSVTQEQEGDILFLLSISHGHEPHGPRIASHGCKH